MTMLNKKYKKEWLELEYRSDNDHKYTRAGFANHFMESGEFSDMFDYWNGRGMNRGYRPTFIYAKKLKNIKLLAYGETLKVKSKNTLPEILLMRKGKKFKVFRNIFDVKRFLHITLPETRKLMNLKARGSDVYIIPDTDYIIHDNIPHIRNGNTYDVI